LFKICEGRTAHKGARHGLKMNGKLARIQEQEKLELQKLEEHLENQKKKKLIKEEELENQIVKKKRKNKDIE
jgi:hypothetical protein